MAEAEAGNTEQRLGSVRISPHVLSTIVRLTTLSVPGVVRMSRNLSSNVDRLLKGKTTSEGVRIEVVDDTVSVDVFIVVAGDTNIYELGLQVQARVARAIKDMVGMPVLAVNVHVEDAEVAPIAR
jgi:uncharacterized alkaline shock family protein YloU